MLLLAKYWSTGGFPDSSVGKESACSAGDPGSVPESRRCSGEGKGYPLQYSCASIVAQLVRIHLHAGDLCLIPGLGRSSGEGRGYPLQYSWASLVVQLVRIHLHAGDLGFIPGLGRSSGEGNPLQYSGLKESIDCRVLGVPTSWAQLSNFHFHFHLSTGHKRISHIHDKMYMWNVFALTYYKPRQVIWYFTKIIIWREDLNQKKNSYAFQP